MTSSREPGSDGSSRTGWKPPSVRSGSPEAANEPLGGAISRTGEDETALGRRDVPWCYHALAMWMEPDQETADAHMAWARGLAHDQITRMVDHLVAPPGIERIGTPRVVPRP